MRSLSKKGNVAQLQRASPHSESRDKNAFGRKLALGLFILGILAFGVASLLPNVIDKVMEYRSDVRVVKVHVDFDRSEYGGASVKEALTDGDKTYLLYPTYDDNSKAIKYVRTKSSEMLSILRSKYHMYIPLTVFTYKLFETLSAYLENDPDCPRGYSESDGYFVFQKFGDIYENEEENRLLKRTAFSQGLDKIKDGLVEYKGQKRYKPRR